MVRLGAQLNQCKMVSLIIVLVSMLSACVPPRLEIQPPNGPPVPPTGPDFDLSGQLPELLLAPPGSFPARPASAALTDSLTDMLGGDYAVAADRLADSLNRLEPGAERRATADLLGETLFLLGDWDRFLHYASSYSAGLYDDRVLAQTFLGQAPLQAVIPTESVTLPLTASPIGTPALDVRVNGQNSRFWLDTGAGLTVLTESTARAVASYPPSRRPPPTRPRGTRSLCEERSSRTCERAASSSAICPPSSCPTGTFACPDRLATPFLSMA